MYFGIDRILIVIVAIAFIVWRIKSRWDAASDYVENESEERRAWKKGFPKFKENSDFKFLLDHIQTTHKITFDEPQDDDTFKVIFACLYDEKMTQPTLENPDAKYLTIFIKNKKSKKAYSMTLETKEIHESEGMLVDYGVPSWAKD